MKLVRLLIFSGCALVSVAIATSAQSLKVQILHGSARMPDGQVEWQLVLSNSTPQSIHFSHFSLANLIRRTKIKDGAGRVYEIPAPKDLIHPAAPDIDMKGHLQGFSNIVVTVRTDLLVVKGKDGFGSGSRTNRPPSSLIYEVEGEILITIDSSRKLQRWMCSGIGRCDLRSQRPIEGIKR